MSLSCISGETRDRFVFFCLFACGEISRGEVNRAQLARHSKDQHRGVLYEITRPPNLARKSSACTVSSTVLIRAAVRLHSMHIWTTFFLACLRLHVGIHFPKIVAVAFKSVLMAVFARFVVAAFVSVPVMGL